MLSASIKVPSPPIVETLLSFTCPRFCSRVAAHRELCRLDDLSMAKKVHCVHLAPFHKLAPLHTPPLHHNIASHATDLLAIHSHPHVSLFAQCSDHNILTGCLQLPVAVALTWVNLGSTWIMDCTKAAVASRILTPLTSQE